MLYNNPIKPDIYLDINGVLLINDQSLAIGAVEFIKYATAHFDVYWLTTHRMNGDPAHAVEYVQRAADDDIKMYLKKIMPTSWSMAKTKAIKFNRPFLWFDDDCYSGERMVLKKYGAFNSWIEVNLLKYPDQLTHEIQLLRSLHEAIRVT